MILSNVNDSGDVKVFQLNRIYYSLITSRPEKEGEEIEIISYFYLSASQCAEHEVAEGLPGHVPEL